MDDVHKIFSDFKNRVDEIAEHAEHVHSVSFKAELKNGTSFNFSYNAEKFAKIQEPRGAFKAYSVFNGIVDIIASLASIALLVYLILKMIAVQELALLPVLTYALFIMSFIFSALFHFFSPEQKAHLIFSYLKESTKIFALAFVNLLWAYRLNPSMITLVQSLTLVLIAIAFLFLSGRTQLSVQISLVITALLPLVSLFADASMESLLRTILFSLWSITALFFKQDSRMKTNSIFALMGILSLSITFSALL
ncbi:MAG: hypothetical protein ACQ5SW_07150 [Sphaerochaetaceae bacterium]